MLVGSASRRLRVDSCLRVIHDVSQLISRQGIHPRIVEQLKRLDELLSLIDHESVTDSDLERIERSTNQLMHELGALFDHHRLGSLYREAIH